MLTKRLGFSVTELIRQFMSAHRSYMERQKQVSTRNWIAVCTQLIAVNISHRALTVIRLLHESRS